MQAPPAADSVGARVRGVDPGGLRAALETQGWARLDGLLSAGECDAIARLYDEEDRFRARIVMARHGFGQGEYKYFAYPLPAWLQALRAALYGMLVDIANGWEGRAGAARDFPARHEQYIAACHAAGQGRPTPLMLAYGPGDYNALHQDLYGELVFPLQATVLLSAPGADFTGGEFVLVEQRPRRQSRAEVVPLRKADAVVFPVSTRPVADARGFHRVTMRHGVSAVREGRRMTLGVIFHDAA
jgi:hypothetical protein